MAEYIDKVAATTIPTPPKENRVYQTYNLDDVFDAGWYEAQRCISNLPAVNVRENVKSKWEDVEITMITEDNAPSEIVSMFCPVCRRYHNEVYYYGNPIETANFCPRCGADMTGGNDG